jgi:energy-coupling factor transporter ATP-binding protein EcfA2
MPNPSSPSVSSRGLLVKWALTQDAWLREVTAAVLESGKELSEAQIEEAYQHLLVEKGLGDGEPPTAVELTAAGANGAPETPLTILGVDCVKRVNLLAEGQTLEFSPKLTVLFGRNGCGKTGYVRILRCLASARREERVLPDITSTTPITDPPECRVRYALGGAEQAPHTWKGEAGVAPFTRVDVFDAQDARTYVDGDLTYLYTPADVALFRYISLALQGVRARLDEARRAKAPGQNLFAAQIPREATFYAKIDGLGASTDLDVLKKLAEVTADEEASLPGLRETIGALGSQSVQAQIQAAQAELEVYTRAKNVADHLSAFGIAKHNDALATLQTAETNRTTATQAAFADENLPGFLTPEWRAFIESGETYLKSLDLSQYPTSNDECAYCRQPLTRAAVALLEKYREFCNDSLERAVSAAREALDTIRRPVLAVDVDALAQLMERQLSAVPQGQAATAGLVATRTAIVTARKLREALRSDAALPGDVLPANLAADGKRIADSREQMTARVAALRGQAQERERLLKEANTKKVQLEGRLTLRALFPALAAYVERAKWVDLANTALRRLQPIAKSLTDASKLASERLMNEGFEKLFREECKRLSAPDVSLDFHGSGGEAARRKLLRPEYKLSDTLSEGEQKVIALADFLAEARLRGVNAPVIFDDPVTSLDYERLGEVARRVAFLANDRQVIVFTHNIWFAVELLDRFRDRKKECAYFDVRTVEGRKGVVSGGTHPRTDTLADLRKRINVIITDAKKATGESQDALIFRGSSLLRSLCEVIAETELLQGVVRRYEPSVMLTKLPAIKPAALKAAGEVIYPVYENTCRYIDSHSQPLEHLNITRTVDELETDFRAVLGAVDAYQKAAA